MKKTNGIFEKMEELHIQYEVTLVRHRSYTDVERLIAIFDSLPEATKRNISVMRDHKGSLSVLWRKLPSFYQRRTVQMAWEAADECDVQHGWIASGADDNFLL